MSSLRLSFRNENGHSLAAINPYLTLWRDQSPRDPGQASLAPNRSDKNKVLLPLLHPEAPTGDVTGPVSPAHQVQRGGFLPGEGKGIILANPPKDSKHGSIR